MKTDWKTVKIEDLKSDADNSLVTGPFGSAISSRFFVAAGVPVIRGSNLGQDVGVRLIDESLVFVTPEKAQEFRRSIARQGDLIFTCWGTIDQIGLIDGRARFNEYVISNKQMKLTPHPARADSLFLYYAFSSPFMRERILKQGIGSSVPGFNLGQLRNIEIRLPPLRDQQAIACILGALDDKIDLNRRMNQTLEAIARAVFKSWFVDFDPVRAKAAGKQPPGLAPHIAELFPDAFEDSDLGDIPKGWRVCCLPELLEINPSRQLSKGAVAPYLDMGKMPTQGHAPDSWIEREAGSGMKFINGDTLVARITPCLENGKTAFIDFLNDGQVGWGSTEYIVLRPRQPIPNIFAYLLARSDDFRAFAIQRMTGSSGRQRVPADSLHQYFLPAPANDSPLFVAFGRIVNPLFDRARSAMEQNRTLSTLRDALLPKLISGELRVPDAERIVGRCV